MDAVQGCMSCFSILLLVDGLGGVLLSFVIWLGYGLKAGRVVFLFSLLCLAAFFVLVKAIKSLDTDSPSGGYGNDYTPSTGTVGSKTQKLWDKWDQEFEEKWAKNHPDDDD